MGLLGIENCVVIEETTTGVVRGKFRNGELILVVEVTTGFLVVALDNRLKFSSFNFLIASCRFLNLWSNNASPVVLLDFGFLSLLSNNASPIVLLDFGDSGTFSLGDSFTEVFLVFFGSRLIFVRFFLIFFLLGGGRIRLRSDDFVSDE